MAKDGSPVVERLHLGERLADEDVLRMRSGVLDAEFSHVRAGSAATVKLLGQPEMFKQDFALLEEAGSRRQRPPLGQRAGLRENPRVADRSTGDRDAIDAGLANHFQAV